MTVLDSGFHPVDSGFRVLDSGFQKGLDSKLFFCFDAFLRISFSCSNLAILKRRLECITSLFLFRFINYVKKYFTVPYDGPGGSQSSIGF